MTDHQMQPTFNFDAGERTEEVGMQSAAEARDAVSLLETARQVARRLAIEHGETNADDVGEIMDREHGIKTIGPAAGSLFKGSEWEFTGRRVRSSRVSNHARELKIWRLKEA